MNPGADRFFGLEWLYLKRGETLFNQGDPADNIYILQEGLVRATDGRNRIETGTLIGGLSWLTNASYETTVVALRDSDIIYMTRENFETYVQRHPSVLRKLAAGIVRQLREVTRPEALAPSSPFHRHLTGNRWYRRLHKADRQYDGRFRDGKTPNSRPREQGHRPPF